MADRLARHAFTVLMAGHGKTQPHANQRQPVADPGQLVALKKQLYDASTSTDRSMVWSVVKQMQAAGLCNQTIKGPFVTAVARQLGEDWVNDTATFGAVTIGCARLQAIVRHIEPEPPQSEDTQTTSQKNCLVVVPKGSQHTLGAVVLTDQLRHSGELVKLVLGVDAAAMASLVQSQTYDAVMISAATGENIEKLQQLVRGARNRSHSPTVVIGGSIVDQKVDLVAATGTDYVSLNPREALDFCSQSFRAG